MAAEVLSQGGARVRIIDQKRSPGRKFLLAGRGGLNLTHSEPLENLMGRYGNAKALLEPAIRAFPPEAIIAWCQGLGVETFVGTSGRIFPKTMKASPLLRAWLQRLDQLDVQFSPSTRWQGFDGAPTILAMGGASWPELGSNAAWVPQLRKAGIHVNDFKPSNSRILVPWTEHFKSRHAGAPLKNLALQYGSAVAKGEMIISAEGLEGGAIYQLSRTMREEPGKPLFIDLKPALSGDAIAQRLAQPKGSFSTSNFLRRALGLTPAAIALLRETKSTIDAEGIKRVTLHPEGAANIARAISSAGGVALDEVNENFQLVKFPEAYAVGEMLDWDAPTGGYLLQACFATGAAAGRDLLSKLPHLRHI
jgi:uncharacterized flavoprotein (TIGR03862 family)